MMAVQRGEEEQPDALLFFRMAIFYELFGDDAVTASRELGLTLTSRTRRSALPMPAASRRTRVT